VRRLDRVARTQKAMPEGEVPLGVVGTALDGEAAGNGAR